MRTAGNAFRRLGGIGGAVASVALALSLATPSPAMAGVPYMPNVTEGMSSPSYWSGKVARPDSVLATPEEISRANAAILADPATCMNDLLAYTEEPYDGVAYGDTLKAAALSDARYFFDLWARYDADGNYLATWEDAYAELYAPMVENAKDPAATTSETIRYAVGVNRTCVLSLPSTSPLRDDPSDPDFDYQYQTMLRVNEPAIVDASSADGLFSHVITSCTRGWVANADIGICKDREEWLSAWQTDGTDILVICDDKIRTETSRYSPETSNRLLPMGTCLQLADEGDWESLREDTNRSGHNSHVMWMPCRGEDGAYSRKLALVPEHANTSEGYLPLTAGNLATVALRQLGDCYGWGGMLDSDDCSGYVRDVYKCFGYELPRNTTWQEAMPTKTYDLAGLSAGDKAAAISALPLGTILIFNGHEMLYLGSEGDDQYVISSISNAYIDGTRTRVRSCVINTLDDITRTSGNTWLDDLTSAKVPFRPVGYEDPTYVAASGDGGTWVRGGEALAVSFERAPDDGDCLAHFMSLAIDGTEIDPGLYAATRGSTVLTLSEGLLSSLSTGTHALEARFDDGKGNATFAVADPQAFSVTVRETSHGSVTVDRSEATEGTVVGIEAKPDNGYEVASVRAMTVPGGQDVPVADSEGRLSLSMPASDVEVEATFVAKPGGDQGKRDGSGSRSSDGADEEMSSDASSPGAETRSAAKPVSFSLTPRQSVLPAAASPAASTARKDSGNGLPGTYDRGLSPDMAACAVAGSAAIALWAATRLRLPETR